MKKVYIISRYRANSKRELEFNKEVARYFCRQVIDEGNNPIATHLYYTQFLDDNYELDRELGLSFGIKELQQADEFLAIVIDGIISEGMANEIKVAIGRGMTGRFVYMTKREVKELMKVIR